MTLMPTFLFPSLLVLFVVIALYALFTVTRDTRNGK